MSHIEEPPARAFHGATVPTPPIPDDDGGASPELRRELDQLARGRGSGPAVLTALSAARLFVPVVAVLETESIDADGLRHENQSSMATVLIDSPEHGRALLAFSCLESLSRWRPDARPVPTAAPLAARAAVGESADALVVDVAGPTPFALQGDELLLMAAVARPTDPAEPDPVIERAVARVLGALGYEGAAHEVRSMGADRPASLEIHGVGSEHARAAIVDRLSREQVVNRLLPQGLRVNFRDTP
ncbi:MAG: SseB family protein [Actinomycetes bacterium]